MTISEKDISEIREGVTGVSEAAANAGGKALRERQMAGRITRDWDAVPKSERRKWVDTAREVIRAARAI